MNELQVDGKCPSHPLRFAAMLVIRNALPREMINTSLNLFSSIADSAMSKAMSPHYLVGYTQISGGVREEEALLRSSSLGTFTSKRVTLGVKHRFER